MSLGYLTIVDLMIYTYMGLQRVDYTPIIYNSLKRGFGHLALPQICRHLGFVMFVSKEESIRIKYV